MVSPISVSFTDDNKLPLSTILDEARSLIYGEREQNYGSPHKLFKQWSKLVSVYTGKNITETDLAVIMVLLKLLRLKNSNYKHRDSLIDAAGYIGLLERITQGMQNEDTGYMYINDELLPK